MNSKILISIYELVNNGIKIWFQNNKIQLVVLNNAVFSEDQKNFIKVNKHSIINCLKENKVYSKEYNTIILKKDSDCPCLSFAMGVPTTISSWLL